MNNELAAKAKEPEFPVHGQKLTGIVGAFITVDADITRAPVFEQVFNWLKGDSLGHEDHAYSVKYVIQPKGSFGVKDPLSMFPASAGWKCVKCTTELYPESRV